MWEDELHNVVQMSFATTAPMSSQDVDGIHSPTNNRFLKLLFSNQITILHALAGSVEASQMKVEP